MPNSEPTTGNDFTNTPGLAPQTEHQPKSDLGFYLGLGILCFPYVFLILAMLAAAGGYAFVGPNEITVSKEFAQQHPTIARLSANPICNALVRKEIQYSIALSLISCAITTILCLWGRSPNWLRNVAV